MATDIAEFLGGALGISLLFHVSLLCGLLYRRRDHVILLLDRGGFRPLELVIATLVAVIGLSYLCELFIAPPDWHAALLGSVVPQLPEAMPSRWPSGSSARPSCRIPSICIPGSRKTVRLRVTIRNAAGSVVFEPGGPDCTRLCRLRESCDGDDVSGRIPRSADGISDIGVAYHSLIPLLGVGAATVFLIALMASGISSSVVGTMAGQVIMQGFVDFTIPVWTRRLMTMAPAFVIGLHFNVAMRW